MALVGAPLLVTFVSGHLSDDGNTATEPSGAQSSAPSPSRPDLHASASLLGITSCTALATAPTALEDRAELAAGGDWSGLISRHSGAALGQLHVGITLQGGDRALTIDSIDIEPRAGRASPPHDGALLCWAGQGDEPRVQLAADMDLPEPYLHDEESPTLPHFRDSVITLAPHEQVSLAVSFRAEEGHREFELIIRYVLDGERGSLPVPPPDGQEYAVTAPADTYEAAYLSTVTGTRQMDSQEICQWTGAHENC
ncbi:hypothetical protein [Streptomyces sp. YIM 98790]|uniref:hypothetical protein n=1 Tax=Streptomyces sp. YIM 98790 TaxID=2689077 RepID=UPI001407CB1C|nr:hypothetical protein [Streptomyces sp. YIM 98790]